MAEARIQILIPTYNNVKELDRTMESIKKQNYDPQNIYVTIVDFGSEDGTYEKAMSYDREHLGIYTRPFQKNWRQRIIDAARIAEYVRPEGMYCFYILLYPGDIVYPNCLQVLSGKYIENYGLNPTMVFCESDIFTDKGEIQRQKPLFSKDCIIDGNLAVNEYIKRGYRHQIFQMVSDFSKGRRRENYEKNEGRCWNKLVWRNNGRMAIYVQEPLACTRKIIYEDEMQEILYRWEAHMYIVRRYMNKYGYIFDENFLQLANENLAEYALWRSFSLYQGKVDWKIIEDCFLISKIIAHSIENKEIYQKMRKLIVEKNEAVLEFINEYYEE